MKARRRRKRYQITAYAYDKRGRLLSVGHNSYVHTHPLQAEYARRAGRPQAIFLHAELAALLRARRPVHRLVVKRFNSDGQPELAKPCSICQFAISDWNVQQVEHT